MPITFDLGDMEADARRAAQVAGMDLPAFLREAVRATLHAPYTTVAPRLFDGWTDDALLAAIRAGFPVGFRKRYRELRKKRDAGSLFDSEREELIRCSDRVTGRDAERLPLLIELPRRRKTDVPTLIDRLQLRRQVT